jgi:hypothetical protein
MTNKNPFEIRLDVLKMAQEMMDKELELNAQKYYHQIEAAKQVDIGALNGAVDNAPKMYTPEDLVAKASALYNFVSDSSSATNATRYVRNDKSSR